MANLRAFHHTRRVRSLQQLWADDGARVTGGGRKALEGPAESQPEKQNLHQLRSARVSWVCTPLTHFISLVSHRELTFLNVMVHKSHSGVAAATISLRGWLVLTASCESKAKAWFLPSFLKGSQARHRRIKGLFLPPMFCRVCLYLTWNNPLCPWYKLAPYSTFHDSS